jgi:hypothetical protein
MLTTTLERCIVKDLVSFTPSLSALRPNFGPEHTKKRIGRRGIVAIQNIFRII